MLPTPVRRPSGYREYADGAVDRVLLVRRLQSVGLTLDEIVEFLAVHDGGGATCESERWRLHAAQRRIRERIEELVAVENQSYPRPRQLRQWTLLVKRLEHPESRVASPRRIPLDLGVELPTVGEELRPLIPPRRDEDFR